MASHWRRRRSTWSSLYERCVLAKVTGPAPVRMVTRPECQESLRKLKTLFIDCGSKDQYFLQYGARQFVRQLKGLGIAHHYEEFDDDHSNIDYRMDVSLPFLYRALVG